MYGRNCNNKLPDNARFCNKCGMPCNHTKGKKKNKMLVGLGVAFAVILILVIAYLVLRCPHSEWTKATCTEPSRCVQCGKKEGEPLGHIWKDATCMSPKVCVRCEATEGEPDPNKHVWQEASCRVAKTCIRCGEKEGEPLGHDMKKKSCTSSVCTRCGYTSAIFEHDFGENYICKICGAVDENAPDIEMNFYILNKSVNLLGEITDYWYNPIQGLPISDRPELVASYQWGVECGKVVVELKNVTGNVKIGYSFYWDSHYYEEEIEYVHPVDDAYILDTEAIVHVFEEYGKDVEWKATIKATNAFTGLEEEMEIPLWVMPRTNYDEMFPRLQGY